MQQAPATCQAATRVTCRRSQLAGVHRAVPPAWVPCMTMCVSPTCSRFVCPARADAAFARTLALMNITLEEFLTDSRGLGSVLLNHVLPERLLAENITTQPSVQRTNGCVALPTVNRKPITGQAAQQDHSHPMKPYTSEVTVGMGKRMCPCLSPIIPAQRMTLYLLMAHFVVERD